MTATFQADAFRFFIQYLNKREPGIGDIRPVLENITVAVNERRRALDLDELVTTKQVRQKLAELGHRCKPRRTAKKFISRLPKHCNFALPAEQKRRTAPLSVGSGVPIADEHQKRKKGFLPTATSCRLKRDSTSSTARNASLAKRRVLHRTLGHGSLTGNVTTSTTVATTNDSIEVTRHCGNATNPWRSDERDIVVAVRELYTRLHEQSKASYALSSLGPRLRGIQTNISQTIGTFLSGTAGETITKFRTDKMSEIGKSLCDVLVPCEASQIPQSMQLCSTQEGITTSHMLAAIVEAALYHWVFQSSSWFMGKMTDDSVDRVLGVLGPGVESLRRPLTKSLHTSRLQDLKNNQSYLLKLSIAHARDIFHIIHDVCLFPSTLNKDDHCERLGVGQELEKALGEIFADAYTVRLDIAIAGDRRYNFFVEEAETLLDDNRMMWAGPRRPRKVKNCLLFGIKTADDEGSVVSKAIVV